MSLGPIIGLFFFAALSVLLAGSPEAPPFRVRSWGMESGLPHPRVVALARGDDGFLWLATPGGIVRFDGMNFFPLAGMSGMAVERVTVLARGHGNRIWAGTAEGAIHVIEGGRIGPQAAVAVGTLAGGISGLVEDAGGTLWISTSGGQVAKLTSAGISLYSPRWSGRSGKTFLVKQAPGLGVAVGSESGWWLTGDGEPKALPATPPEQALRFFAPGTGGRCWFGTDDGAWLLAGDKTLQRIALKLPSLAEAPRTAVDGTGGLWVSGDGGALHFCGADGSQAEILLHDRRGSLSVLALLADSENSVWVGTDTGGLSRISPALFQRWQQWDLNSPRPSEGGGGPDGGATRRIVIAPSSEGVVAAAGGKVPPSPVASLAPKSAAAFENTSEMLAKLPGQGVIHAIYTDTDQSLWIGRTGPDPLVHYSDGEFHPVTFPGKPPDGVSSLLRDPRGRLWIGSTQGGVFHLDGGPGARSAGLASGPRGGAVTSILATSDTVWFATRGSGLLRWKHGIIKSANREAGLPDDRIFAMQADDSGGLWLSGQPGFFRLDRPALETWFDGGGPFPHPVLFDESDGMKVIEGFPDTHNGSYKSDDGSIWFSSGGAMYQVRPWLYQVPPDPPAAAVTECIADGVTLADTTRMPLGARNLEFRFTGLALVHPESVRFACRLVPHDDDWVDMGENRTVSYTDLPSGRYRFEVSAVDRYGRSSVSPAGLDFLMPTPVWRSPGFVVLYALTGAGLIFLLIQAFIRHRLKPLREREKIANALADERRRIARDMHDEIGTGLCEIALLGNRLEKSVPQHAEAKRVARRSLELARSIDETVWMLNPRNDTLENLATYLTNAVTKWMRDSPLRPRFDIDTSFGEVEVPTDARRHLYLACKEIVCNAIKHSGGSELWLHIHRLDSGFVIEIHDNGSGMTGPPGAGRSGLANLRERMAEIGGILEIGASPAGGARITLSLPRFGPKLPSP